MSSALIERLKPLALKSWFPRAPASPEALDALEAAFKLKLPEDYRSLLLYSDGGSLTGASGSINLESSEDLQSQNLDERFEESLPGMFVIGDDGGGAVFFLDPANRLGRGEASVFIVSLGALSFEWARFAGSSITQVIEEILNGARFFERPRLGAKSG